MKKNDLTLPYLSSFCMSMDLVMQAGIPLDEGTRMLAEDEKESGGDEKESRIKNRRQA